MTMTGKGNKCPICGKEFEATPPLVPNTTDREFYGGRIKFFKEVDCDCTARYKLCIEQRYNRAETKEELNVIDMIVLKEGIPNEERYKNMAQKIIHERFEEGKTPTKREREEIRKEVVLANILDLDTKVQTLCMHTLTELQLICRANKVKYTEKMNKTQIAKLLLAKNPNLVEANPQD